MKGYEELRTVPAPDLWNEISRRLDDPAAEERYLHHGTSWAARAAGGGSAPRTAHSPGARRRGCGPGWPAWPRWAAPLAAAAAVLAVAGSLAVVGQSHRRQETGPGRPVTFPGGGRILLAGDYGLEWFYPGGRTSEIAPGYIGARLAVGGTKILAWRPTRNPKARPPCMGCFADVDYYLMNLDGTGRRMVLRAEPTSGNIQAGHLSVEVSPAGTRLAYVRQVESRSNGHTLSDELWTLDIVTGRKTDLGPAPSSDSAVAWMDDSTLLAESADSTALRLVNVDTGRKTTYLTVFEPRIVRAYERARPGAGPPTAIDPIGWSTDSHRSALAVLLRGVSHRQPTKAVLALVGRSRILTFAPDRNPLASLTWGPGGIFLLHTTVGDNPCCARTYAGIVQTPQVSRQQTFFGEPWDAAAFNPEGRVIALDYGGGATIAFIPASAPACDRAGGCRRFRPEQPLHGVGSLQAWAP
jgi:hypothetical protein